MHLKPVIKLLSTVVLVIACFMLIPAAVGIILHETTSVLAFCFTISAMLVLGGLGLLLGRKESFERFSQRDGFFFTTLTWIIATAFGALPLVLSGTLANYSDAFFEIMSGFTTTGATRITDVESCTRSILLWRSMTNWLGGMGIVVLFVSILPAVGKGAGAFFLMGAETVGPVKSKLTPKTRNTAVVLWGIYFCMTVLQVVLLLFSGIGLFDSITIAFSTVSTAGFSVRNASIGAYNSAYVDAVVTVFMYLAAVNFSLYFKLFFTKEKHIFRDTEFITYTVIVLAAILGGALYLTLNAVYPGFFTSLRYMSFQVASIISTTGFTTAAYTSWPSFALFILVMLMFIGGCAGSTGGGMKVTRLAIAFRSCWNTVKRKNHPYSVNNVSVYNLSDQRTIVPENQISEILSYIVLYIGTWLAGSFIVSLTGLDIQSAMSASILTLGNIGAGFGTECFANLPHWTNWLFSLLMLAGRLELFTILVLFTRR